METRLANEKGKYLWVVRYRCNHATTCQDCGVSVKGHYSSCQSCGSSKVSKVGCGEESYMAHYIREYTADDNHPQTLTNSAGALLAIRKFVTRMTEEISYKVVCTNTNSCMNKFPMEKSLIIGMILNAIHLRWK